MGRSNTELAAELGIHPTALRRELLFLEASGATTFHRVGTARYVDPSQVQIVRDWLRRRGLLAGEPEGVSPCRA